MGKSLKEFKEELNNRSWWDTYKYAPYWVLDWIIDCPRHIKYFIQRHTRGYADKDLWHLPTSLGPIIVKHLKAFRGMDKISYCGIFKDGEPMTPEQWDKTIDDMIEGWEYLACMDEIDIKLFEDCEAKKIPKEEWLNKKRALDKEMHRKAHLFVDYFLILWD